MNLVLTKQSLLHMELLLLETFQWNLYLPTAAHFIEYCLSIAVHEGDLHDGWPLTCLEKSKIYLAKYAEYFLEVSLQGRWMAWLDVVLLVTLYNGWIFTNTDTWTSDKPHIYFTHFQVFFLNVFLKENTPFCVRPPFPFLTHLFVQHSFLMWWLIAFLVFPQTMCFCVLLPLYWLLRVFLPPASSSTCPLRGHHSCSASQATHGKTLFHVLRSYSCMYKSVA